jgi:hypothetical protein
LHSCVALQGLDEAFVSQAPVLGEGEADEDLLDPSDPTDRQQIHWRQSQQQQQQQEPAPPPGAEAADAPATPAQQASGANGEPSAATQAAGVAVTSVSPATSVAAAGESGYAASAASDVTSATAALAVGEPPGSGSSSTGKQLGMPAQLQKDAFLVFRALCKLSIRSTEASPGSELTTVRGKVGSLRGQSSLRWAAFVPGFRWAVQHSRKGA